jgi:hypothetical protein
MNGPRQSIAPLCPSAQPQTQGSLLIGVVGGSVDQPRAEFLEAPRPVTEDLLQLTYPVAPTEVLRVAAPCIGGACHHFVGRRCALAAKVVQLLPAVVDQVPDCPIRPECRWFSQEGPAACQRCPQVITHDLRPSPEMQLAANPRVPAATSHCSSTTLGETKAPQPPGSVDRPRRGS